MPHVAPPLVGGLAAASLSDWPLSFFLSPPSYRLEGAALDEQLQQLVLDLGLQIQQCLQQVVARGKRRMVVGAESIRVVPEIAVHMEKY